jgi:NTE family protein
MDSSIPWIPEADGVFRGGGVKGIALAGALEGFANHPDKPVRKWVNVAGASAGAIIASYLAVVPDATQPTEGGGVTKIVELLQHETDFRELADFPLHSKLAGLAALPFRHGLARGRAFERWFEELLGGATFGQFEKEPERAGADRDWRLKLIAVDVTQRRLLVLPEDLADYKELSGQPIEPSAFPIARAARMSMAIPYFFEPVELINTAGGVSTIVDGGTLSNFPVWLFDVDPVAAGRPPRRPTFGLTLTGGRQAGGGIERLAPWALRFGFDIFETAREAWDSRFASHSTRVRSLAVETGDVATTDFDLPPEKQQTLLENGRLAARKFLDAFDLATYRNTYAVGPPSPP